MNTISADALIQQLNWRYATKKFDSSRKLSADQWKALEETLRLTPSSFGLQPWKFIAVTSDQLKAQLKPLSWNQDQVVDCSHYVVMCQQTTMDVAHIDAYVADIAKTRGVTVESLKGYREMMVGSVEGPLKEHLSVWNSRQIYIALGNFMTAAAVLGIDTCPMEGFGRGEYNRLLGLEGTGYETVVCCAVGFRSKEDPYASAKKVRFPASKVIEIR